MYTPPKGINYLLDLLIPVGAILVICFALASIYFDPDLHIASQVSHEPFKRYRNTVAQ